MPRRSSRRVPPPPRASPRSARPNRCRMSHLGKKVPEHMNRMAQSLPIWGQTWQVRATPALVDTGIQRGVIENGEWRPENNTQGHSDESVELYHITVTQEETQASPTDSPTHQAPATQHEIMTMWLETPQYLPPVPQNLSYSYGYDGSQFPSPADSHFPLSPQDMYLQQNQVPLSYTQNNTPDFSDLFLSIPNDPYNHLPYAPPNSASTSTSDGDMGLFDHGPSTYSTQAPYHELDQISTNNLSLNSQFTPMNTISPHQLPAPPHPRSPWTGGFQHY